jgi:hypothetical protein
MEISTVILLGLGGGLIGFLLSVLGAGVRFCCSRYW